MIALLILNGHNTRRKLSNSLWPSIKAQVDRQKSPAHEEHIFFQLNKR